MFTLPTNKPRHQMTLKEKKAEQISRLHDVCLVCTMCPLGREMHRDGFRQFDPHVFSNMRDAKIMVVGQNPGVNECMKGEPFVGDAGANFDDALTSNGLIRDRFYITNTVHCHTQDNRAPTPDEIKACSNFIAMEVRILEPVFIITLGSVSFLRLCPNDDYTTSLGSFKKSVFGINVMPIYHPSPRNLSDEHRRARFLSDMKNMCELVRRLDKK